MFLLRAQNNFYVLLSSCVERHVKKNSNLNIMSSVGFQDSKIWMFFGKLTVEQVLKSFSVRNYSVKSSVFGFCDSLPLDIEKSRSWRVLIAWVLG